MISGLEKVKIWSTIKYNKLSELVIIIKIKKDRKMTIEKYIKIILDGEIFDFQIESMKELRYVIMLKDGASYHQGIASVRKEHLEKNR